MGDDPLFSGRRSPFFDGKAVFGARGVDGGGLQLADFYF